MGEEHQHTQGHASSAPAEQRFWLYTLAACPGSLTAHASAPQRSGQWLAACPESYLLNRVTRPTLRCSPTPLRVDKIGPISCAIMCSRRSRSIDGGAAERQALDGNLYHTAANDSVYNACDTARCFPIIVGG